MGGGLKVAVHGKVIRKTQTNFVTYVENERVE